MVFHSDGKVTDILDKLVEIGIDNTKIIPDGSIKDIESHIAYIFEVLGKNGGLIMSSHDIPIHCPHENIEAMVGFIKSMH